MDLWNCCTMMKQHGHTTEHIHYKATVRQAILSHLHSILIILLLKNHTSGHLLKGSPSPLDICPYRSGPCLPSPKKDRPVGKKYYNTAFYILSVQLQIKVHTWCINRHRYYIIYIRVIYMYAYIYICCYNISISRVHLYILNAFRKHSPITSSTDWEDNGKWGQYPEIRGKSNICQHEHEQVAICQKIPLAPLNWRYIKHLSHSRSIQEAKEKPYLERTQLKLVFALIDFVFGELNWPTWSMYLSFRHNGIVH